MTSEQPQTESPSIDWKRAYRELEEQIARMLGDIADATERTNARTGRDSADAEVVQDLEEKVAWLRGRHRQAEAKIAAKDEEIRELRQAIAQQAAMVTRLAKHQ